MHQLAAISGYVSVADGACRCARLVPGCGPLASGSGLNAQADWSWLAAVAHEGLEHHTASQTS